MKLLKTIGKVLAVPFDVITILGKISLLPATIISKLLSGEFTEWNKNISFQVVLYQHYLIHYVMEKIIRFQ